MAASRVQDETLVNFFRHRGQPGHHQRVLGPVTGLRPGRQGEGRGGDRLYPLGNRIPELSEFRPARAGRRLAAAGVAAVIGTHAHVLQGAGWRPDGTYVADGPGNYFWWRPFGNARDDNGVLTLTVAHGTVREADFSPSRLDDTGSHRRQPERWRGRSGAS